MGWAAREQASRNASKDATRRLDVAQLKCELDLCMEDLANCRSDLEVARRLHLDLVLFKSSNETEAKADEPGLAALAKELDLPLEFFDRGQIGEMEDAVPTPSAVVAKHIGVKSVCEATAILAARGGSLIVPKRCSRNATVAVARINFTS